MSRRTWPTLGLLLALLCLTAQRADAMPCGLTPAEAGATAGVLALDWLDWKQTHQFIENPAYVETNPVLGHRPSGAALDHGVLAGVALELAALCLMPDDLRPWFLGMLIGMEIEAVRVNWAVGFHGGF